jgi:tetratricopeptide (TPR) repeat protein
LLIASLAVSVAGPNVACAQRALSPERQVAALVERGQLTEAEALARAGGPALTVALADVLVWRGRLAEAESLYAAAERGRLPSYRSAQASLAELAARHGRRDEAIARADSLTRAFEQGRSWSAADQVAAGRGYVVLGLSDPQAAHAALTVFDAAAALDSSNVDARILAGNLLLNKYNGPDAVETFKDALAIAPGNARATLGLALVQAFEGNPAAAAGARKALDQNPALVGAHLLLARFHLEAEFYDSATADARRALAIDSAATPAWAVLGAVAWLGGDSASFTLARDAATRINPRPADFYSAIAEAAARQRRYDDAVRLARQGVAFDSTSAWALTVLGTNELRTGEMEQGRAHVDRAFAIDPFNLWNKNTLDLLDQLQGYTTVATARFQMVVPKEEADYYRIYLGPLLEQAYDNFAARYDFRPVTPIRIEMYRNHADFSVRGIGLAGLGALGVSFGRVLALDGPAARTAGEFNYGSTAWHELAHTFTLGLSAHRVPRWLSEGLSVLEERRAGRGWGANASPDFIAAYKGGRILRVSGINDGFVRPAFPEQLTMSYYQASLVCEMIEAEHGIAAIRDMLRGYAEGLDTRAVMARVLKTTPAAFDEQFDSWFRKRFATAIANVDASDGRAPVAGAYLKEVALGVALLKSTEFDSARVVLGRAERLFPEDGSGDAAAWYLAQAAYAQGDMTTAAAALARVTARDETAMEANRREAEAREKLGDLSGAMAALDRLMWIEPYNAATHVHMADLAERTADWKRAVVERRAVLALDPTDRLEARYQLARALARSGDREGARREVLQVLEQAPGFEKAQALLLELRGNGGGGR